MTSDIRRYLQSLRKQAGLTQGQLADQMGWTNHTIVSAIERGHRNVSYDEVQQWLSICGETSTVLTSQETEILTILRELNPKQRADIANILNLAQNGTTQAWENIEVLVEFWRKQFGM